MTRLPLFKRAEHNEQFADAFHGQGGPLNVTYPHDESPEPDVSGRLRAPWHRPQPRLQRRSAGGQFSYQVTHKNGERCSAAKGHRRLT